MTDNGADYRGEARRCRMMARTAKTAATAWRWAELADEYEQLAVAVERSGRLGARRTPPQQPQAAQQQQGRLKPNKP
jgi:hypothetical protein